MTHASWRTWSVLLAVLVAVTAVWPFPLPLNAAESSQGVLVLSPTEGTVGKPVMVTGRGFPVGRTIALIWETSRGAVIAAGNLYGGRTIEAATLPLAQVTVRADGTFVSRLTVPRDYGGMHNVVARLDGTEAARAGFRLWPSLRISTTQGPVGTPISFAGEGFGLGTTDSQFHVIYDNRYMGIVSGVATRGTVQFTIYAAGEPGLHRIDVYPNFYGPAYLNNHDGFREYAEVPRWGWNFALTNGRAPLSSTAARGRFLSTRVAGPVPALADGPPLMLSPASGPVGTSVRATAAGFRPGERVELVWQSITGAYIQEGGFKLVDTVIAAAAAGPDGRVWFNTTIPSAAGGWHPMLARAASMTAAGRFGLVRAITVSPLSGPPGTQIHIRITGAGWRSWENTAAVTWDNGYTGYACALGEEKGTINIYLTAVGGPGRRVIGIWPAIFRGPLTVNYGGTQPENQRLPILVSSDLPEYVESVMFVIDLTGDQAAR
ncbi:MAG TPA: hypothetical protein VGR24_02265 [bacterium]|jgi:hypothetical protein|nr:hypothetical protein [bacterium]